MNSGKLLEKHSIQSTSLRLANFFRETLSFGYPATKLVRTLPLFLYALVLCVSIGGYDRTVEFLIQGK